MIHATLRFINNFLPHQMSREIKELYWATIIINLGVGMVAVFEPIYLFYIGYSLDFIMLFYFLVYLIYLFVMPLGARFACYFGTERSMVLASIFLAALYFSLFYIQYDAKFFYVSIIFYALEKVFYWPAYHADFARHIAMTESGREVSSINVAVSLMYVIGPIIAGSLIAWGGFGWLFSVVSIIFLLSNIPLLTTKERYRRHSFSYRESFKTLFQGLRQKALISYLGYAEEVALIIIWPIFISVIVKDNLEVGLIMGFSIMASIVISILAGRFVDNYSKHKILRFSSISHALIWFLRVLVTTAFGVFVVNTLSALAKNVIGIALTAQTYKKVHDGRIMSLVVAFESTLVIGKLVMMAFFGIVFYFVADLRLSFDISFIASGLSSLLYML